MMSTTVERSFPARCPNCTIPTAVAANPHCESASCPWLRCTCNAVFNKAGCIMPAEVAP